MTKKLTKQQLFNNAWNGLKSQGWQKSIAIKPYSSAIIEGACRYRGPENRRCAIGWSIPDDKYELGMEGSTPSSRYIQKAANIPVKLADWAVVLQRVHDSIDMNQQPETIAALMEKGMRKFAKDFDLTIPEEATS